MTLRSYSAIAADESVLVAPALALASVPPEFDAPDGKDEPASSSASSNACSGASPSERAIQSEQFRMAEILTLTE
jgi:hypothetical protein